MAQARRLCIQWDDTTGAINVVASDAIWNAVPGNITNLAAVLAPQYRAKPDFDPPAAPAATAVEVANWKLEVVDMHFAYTLAQNTLSLALLAMLMHSIIPYS